MKHKTSRARSSTVPDARIVKSGHLLRGAVLSLLERKALDQITIRDIAAESGVHYATFFRHYATKEALLEDVAADQIRRLVDLTLPVMDTVDSHMAFVALCNYVNDHWSLWTTLLTGGAAGAMREELLKVSREVAIERAPKDSFIPVELSVRCTVSVIVETLIWWLKQPIGSFPIEQVAQMLYRLVLSPSMLEELDHTRLATISTGMRRT